VKKGGEEEMRRHDAGRARRSRPLRQGRLDAGKVYEIMVLNARRESTLNTDEASVFMRPGRRFQKHETVTHSAEEYVRYLKDGTKVHTNTVEGYFSIFKRGMIAAKSTFTATLPSSISAIRTVSR
jgi:hypothetical protein